VIAVRDCSGGLAVCETEALGKWGRIQQQPGDKHGNKATDRRSGFFAAVDSSKLTASGRGGAGAARSIS
jgi:hypothetical protein